MFFLNSILLGFGLGVDAFSVSLANGLNEANMGKWKGVLISATFALFQMIMPIIGWILVHLLIGVFDWFEGFVPWIALILLLFIGGKMVFDGIKKKEDDHDSSGVGFVTLMAQGVATSIDALSVGFTIASYNFLQAFGSSLIIALVTFLMCVLGVTIGKRFGTKLSNKASILGGIVLIVIGVEIFIKGFLG